MVLYSILECFAHALFLSIWSLKVFHDVTTSVFFHHIVGPCKSSMMCLHYFVLLKGGYLKTFYGVLVSAFYDIVGLQDVFESISSLTFFFVNVSDNLFCHRLLFVVCRNTLHIWIFSSKTARPNYSSIGGPL